MPVAWDRTKTVGLDTETLLFATGRTLPPLVCCSMAAFEDDGTITRRLYKWDDPALEELLVDLLSDPAVRFVGANLAYDMAVFCVQYPKLIPLIFNAYDEGQICDVILMEVLRHISTVGNTEYLPLPDGSLLKRSFTLAEIEKQHLGVDRAAEKDEKNVDAWRLRYGELRDVPLDQWPTTAVTYATDDAVSPLLVYERLREIQNPDGFGSMNTMEMQAAASFALTLMTAWGAETDQARVARLVERLEEILAPEKMQPLYDAGLLSPAVPGRPKKGGGLTKGAAEKKNMAEIKAYVEAACAERMIAVKKTAPSTRYPEGQTSADSDVWTQLKDAGDPLAAAMLEREHHIKLKTSFVPVLQSPVVHFAFWPLVTTGRTSSRESSGFASTNGQNQPRIGGDLSVRECFVARKGKLWVSSDYAGIELCSVGQITYELFKESVHRDTINAGRDPHAFLGSLLAATLDPAFSALVQEKRLDRDQTYEAFLACKKSPDEATRKFFKHYRTFAKPTGLGYPGGLGPDTFVIYARDTYGVEVDRDTAERLRTIWRSVYTEMPKYFEWVVQQGDPHNVGYYAYTSACGMYRAGCTYTEFANGCAMQTRAAEGAKIALFRLARECYDWTRGSILYGARPLDFIHDEIIVEIDDDEKAHDKALAISQIMVDSMRIVMPDLLVKAEPALMRRWYKDADPVYDAQRRLIPWEPSK